MSTPTTAREIIDALDLAPLEGEGGFFRRTWTVHHHGDERPDTTTILYLILPDSFSALHRLDHDEMFHFYLGDPCRQVMVSPDGEVSDVVLGHDVTTGMHVQHVVPAGYWQGTRLVDGGQFALLGTTNSPGFSPDGFELATGDTVSALPAEARERVRDLVADTDQGVRAGGV